MTDLFTIFVGIVFFQRILVGNGELMEKSQAMQWPRYCTFLFVFFLLVFSLESDCELSSIGHYRSNCHRTGFYDTKDSIDLSITSWRAELPNVPFFAPMIAGEKVLVPESGGLVEVFSVSDGKKIDSLKLDSEIVSASFDGDGRILLLSRDCIAQSRYGIYVFVFGRVSKVSDTETSLSRKNWHISALSAATSFVSISPRSNRSGQPIFAFHCYSHRSSLMTICSAA